MQMPPTLRTELDELREHLQDAKGITDHTLVTHDQAIYLVKILRCAMEDAKCIEHELKS